MSVPVGVLVSGSGTNLQALLRAQGDDFHVAVVVSNRLDVLALERARLAGVPATVVPHRGRSRVEFEDALRATLAEHGVQWVALAGFLRVLTARFLDAFPGRVLNMHPALLPSFPGLHGQEQAWQYGVRIAGATVHLVDAGTDTGPIIAQGAVPVLADDDLQTLRERILVVEHRLYPMALRWAVQGRLRVEGRRVHVDLPPGEQTWVWGG